MGKGHEQQRRRSQYKDVLLSQPPPGSSEEDYEWWIRTQGKKEREACILQLLAPLVKGGPLQVFNSPAFLGCTWIREALGQEARGSSLRRDHVSLCLSKAGGSPCGSGCCGSGQNERMGRKTMIRDPV